MATIETVPLEVQWQILKSFDDFNSLRRATIASRVLMRALQTDRKRILATLPKQNTPWSKVSKRRDLPDEVLSAWCKGE